MPYISSVEALQETITQRSLAKETVIDFSSLGEQLINWTDLFYHPWSLPYALSIDFGDQPVSSQQLDALIRFIKTKKREVIGLSFSFWGDNSLDLTVCELIIKALSEGYFPLGFSLIISAKNIEHHHLFPRFTAALHTEKTPAWVSVDFFDTPIADENIAYLVTALKNNVFPLATSIKVGLNGQAAHRNEIFRACQYFAQEAKRFLSQDQQIDGQVLAILKAKISPYLSDSSLKINRHIVETNYRSVLTFKRNFNAKGLNQHNVVYLQDWTEIAYLQCILNADTSYVFDLLIDCSAWFLESEAIDILIEILSRASFRGIICSSLQNISRKGLEKLAYAAISGRLQPYSSYHLSIENLERFSFFHEFFQIIFSPKCVSNLTIVLTGEMLKENLCWLSDFLTEAEIPSGLTLDIGQNGSDEIRSFIAERCPAKPVISFDQDNFEDETSLPFNDSSLVVELDKRRQIQNQIRLHLEKLSPRSKAKRSELLLELSESLNNMQESIHSIISRWKTAHYHKLTRDYFQALTHFGSKSTTQDWIDYLALSHSPSSIAADVGLIRPTSKHINNGIPVTECSSISSDSLLDTGLPPL